MILRYDVFAIFHYHHIIPANTHKVPVPYSGLYLFKNLGSNQKMSV